MPLRAQYIEDVHLGANTYPNNCGRRVAEIYLTARHGGIAQPLANLIWQHILPIYNSVQNHTLPNQRDAYDQLVINAALKIQGTLQAQKRRGGFGIGQKIVNLFMKDLWALRIILPPHEQLLHAPLDRIVLAKLRNVPHTWNARTKVVANGPNAREIADYRSIQQQFRDFHATCPIPFQSVIQMEQFIWHKYNEANHA